ncbi:MAG: CRISPR-associated helicase Cas3' [Campylobacteraceae bacterium]|jgi:CRISPR-associated endonuclease/helicase Cas3|nr:CRISPR-associated helicase Cas3' [Campylobacteraceae bacterium]
MKIWAKRLGEQYQTIEGHTDCVIEESLKQIDEYTIHKVSKLTKWNKEKIKDLIFFCAYFHDIGKATKEFQETIKNGLKSYHPMYSASILENIEKFEYKNEDIYINLLLIVSLTHHTLMPYTANSSKFTFLDEAKDFFENYRSKYELYMQKTCKYNFEFKFSENIKLEIECIEDSLKYIENNNILRTLYSYISGILNIADWLASAKFAKNATNITFNVLPSKEAFISKLSFDKLRSFQENLSECAGSVLVEIPTGEGKTEGSLLWAINNLKNKNTKIIYTLPTQTTSNKLYERIQSFFDKEMCGLIHSSAKVYLEKEYEKDNGFIDENFRSDFLFNKSFNKPVTVSTIDSLLKYFINIGRFNIAIKNFLNSVIIVDEVHSYDFKLMGFLKRFLELCNKEYEVKVCLMSASIPNKTKQLLGIKSYQTVHQNDLFKKKANQITKKECVMDDDFNLLEEKICLKKNTLIIRNTVRSATLTYKRLKENLDPEKFEIILYHAAFKKIDKNQKEKLIFEKLEKSKTNKPLILIATQIVEISLDIDFDILFTDNAPIDALIQRFGRINRKKSLNKKGEVFIYKYDKAFPYKNTYILELTFETIKDGYFELSEYVKWLNIVYDKLFVDDISIKNRISGIFDDAYEKHDKNLKKLNAIEQSEDNYDLRDINVPREDFLLYDDFMNETINPKNYYEYTISLPSCYANKYLYIPQEKLKYRILNLKYSFESGIELPIEDEDEIW